MMKEWETIPEINDTNIESLIESKFRIGSSLSPDFVEIKKTFKCFLVKLRFQNKSKGEAVARYIWDEGYKADSIGDKPEKFRSSRSKDE